MHNVIRPVSVFVHLEVHIIAKVIKEFYDFGLRESLDFILFNLIPNNFAIDEFQLLGIA